MWASLQACEKYLKATLLFEGQEFKPYSHVTMPMVRKIQGTTRIRYKFDSEETAFLKRLQNFGTDRYRQASKYTNRLDLIYLDRCVWKIRRFCRPLRFTNGSEHWDNTAAYNDLTLDDSHKIKIITGYLEKVLKQNNSKLSGAKKHLFEQRQALIWHNFYFSARKRHTVKPPLWSGSRNPPTIYDSNRKKILNKYVR